MSKRALTVSVLTAGLSAGLLAGALSPAAAQGNPVGGQGNVYFLSGAGNPTGQAEKVCVFGDPNDEVYFGDWDKDGTDSPMVRRGNVFYVADEDGETVSVFAYGDAGDQVLIGDWNGDGVDSIAVRRANKFFVKNDNQKTGTADSTFYYGDAGDTVLVGDWDGDKKDTLIVSRNDGVFHVKNDTESGVAEYKFLFGNPNDTILVGDWATGGVDADGHDQIAVRRGFEYHLSEELGKDKTALKLAGDVMPYGNPDDTVFVASMPYTVKDANGQPVLDEKRTATYDADVAATFKGGELKWAYDGSAINNPQAGQNVQAKHVAGDKQYYIEGDTRYYRGGEPVIAADGTHAKWDEDNDTLEDVQIHQAGDIYISPEGAIVRHDEAGTHDYGSGVDGDGDAYAAGDLMTWGDVAADDDNFPKIGELTEAWNLVDHKDGAPKSPGW